MTRGEYRRTLFDRLGPEAVLVLRLGLYGSMVAFLTAGVIMLRLGSRWWAIPVGLVAGAACAASGWWIANGVGGIWAAMFVRGSSTPYQEQFSYQQSLVMRGAIDDALVSFEAVIAQQPDSVSARIKAAELYVRERQNHARAAELLRGAQQSPSLTTGEEIYVANRLADLYAGPLADPGRAMVELRRLIDRHPTTPAAAHARAALQHLKAANQIRAR